MNNQSVTNLRLKFPGASSFIFKDLSLSITPGEKVLLLGPSGCGKSTLLQVMSGIIPHSIEVPLIYDMINIPDSWGFVFQDPDTQFCMPYVDEELAFVLENLNVPREEMDALIKGALKRVGLHDTPLHTSIHSLSQGMKQRLALASVLLLSPDVLYLDEPSALLDHDGTKQIWNTIKDVAEDKTVIIVEHKIDQIADWVDRIVLFNDRGEIIADELPHIIFDRYKPELSQYGIWYPGVWSDYLDSADFTSMMADRKATPTKQQDPLLSLKNFTGYHRKEEKIKIAEALIYPGSWITISGDNGAGKSTFLLALMHLLKTAGHYEVSGEAIDLTAKHKLPPKGLSLVFQNPELQFVTNSVFEEVAFSYRMLGLYEDVINDKVATLLELFQLDLADERHPFQLSIGQKRRLSVAAGVAQGSRILLLDEPTFGQDARNTFVMLEMLERLRSNGTTILMVTHDMKIVDHFATEQWTIAKGELVSIKVNDRTHAEKKVWLHA